MVNQPPAHFQRKSQLKYARIAQRFHDETVEFALGASSCGRRDVAIFRIDFGSPSSFRFMVTDQHPPGMPLPQHQNRVSPHVETMDREVRSVVEETPIPIVSPVPLAAWLPSVVFMPLFQLMFGYACVGPNQTVAVMHCGKVTKVLDEPGCHPVYIAGVEQRHVSTKETAVDRRACMCGDCLSCDSRLCLSCVPPLVPLSLSGSGSGSPASSPCDSSCNRRGRPSPLHPRHSAPLVSRNVRLERATSAAPGP